MRVLYLDADELFSQKVGNELKSLVHSFDLCTNNQDAVNLLSKKFYDVIILEIVLENCTTTAKVIDFIKSSENKVNLKIPIVVVNNDMTEEYSKRILKKKTKVYEALNKDDFLKSLGELLRSFNNKTVLIADDSNLEDIDDILDEDDYRVLGVESKAEIDEFLEHSKPLCLIAENEFLDENIDDIDFENEKSIATAKDGEEQSKEGIKVISSPLDAEQLKETIKSIEEELMDEIKNSSEEELEEIMKRGREVGVEEDTGITDKDPELIKEEAAIRAEAYEKEARKAESRASNSDDDFEKVKGGAAVAEQDYEKAQGGAGVAEQDYEKAQGGAGVAEQDYEKAQGGAGVAEQDYEKAQGGAGVAEQENMEHTGPREKVSQKEASALAKDKKQENENMESNSKREKIEDAIKAKGGDAEAEDKTKIEGTTEHIEQVNDVHDGKTDQLSDTQKASGDYDEDSNDLEGAASAENIEDELHAIGPRSDEESDSQKVSGVGSSVLDDPNQTGDGEAEHIEDIQKVSGDGSSVLDDPNQTGDGEAEHIDDIQKVSGDGSSVLDDPNQTGDGEAEHIDDIQKVSGDGSSVLDDPNQTGDSEAEHIDDIQKVSGDGSSVLDDPNQTGDSEAEHIDDIQKVSGDGSSVLDDPNQTGDGEAEHIDDIQKVSGDGSSVLDDPNQAGDGETEHIDDIQKISGDGSSVLDDQNITGDGETEHIDDIQKISGDGPDILDDPNQTGEGETEHIDDITKVGSADEVNQGELEASISGEKESAAIDGSFSTDEIDGKMGGASIKDNSEQDQKGLNRSARSSVEKSMGATNLDGSQTADQSIKDGEINNKTSSSNSESESDVDHNIEDNDENKSAVKGTPAAIREESSKSIDNEIKNLLSGENVTEEDKQKAKELNQQKAEFNQFKSTDVNDRNKKGQTMLMVASNFGKTDLVEQLVQSGSNLHLKCKKGKSALHYAARSGNTAAIEKLLSYGAKINIRDNEMTEPIFETMAANRPEALQFFIEKGSNPDSKAKGEPLIHHAIRCRNPKIFVTLYEMGADINSKNSKGMNVLAAAKKAKRKDLLMYVIKRQKAAG